jgi:hypothetical protein
MTRLLPLLTGLALVAGTALLHGEWTQRWRPAPVLEQAVARLEHLPGDLGPWKLMPDSLPEDELAQAGAAGSWVRRYVHVRTGQSVLILLLCGRGGPLSVHRPEHCYRGAGFDMTAEPGRCQLPAGPNTTAQFWTAKFVRPESTGTTQLRICWSWFAAGAWQAPDNPRWGLAHEPAVYKLYVIHEIASQNEADEGDPCGQLLTRLVPALTCMLGAETPGDATPGLDRR